MAGYVQWVVTTFQDRLRAWEDAAQQAISGFNRNVVGEPRKTKLERPWIARESQAAAYSAEWCKVFAQPSLKGNLVVRAEKAAAIREGDLFLLTHDALAYSVICRCTEKKLAAPPAGRATLAFESERGIAPVPYQPTASGIQGPAIPEPDLVALYQFFQPPPTMPGVIGYQLVVLAARRIHHDRLESLDARERRGVVLRAGVAAQLGGVRAACGDIRRAGANGDEAADALQ